FHATRLRSLLGLPRLRVVSVGKAAMRAQSFLRKDWLGVLSIGLLVGLPGPSLGQTSNAPLPPYAAAIAALERFVEQERVDKQLPALSVALVLDQRILWAKGFGFAKPTDKTPATAN